MTKLELQMVDCLQELKDDYGVLEIKAEFEAEATRNNELIRLKDITSRVGLPIILKIGGAEAITDVYNAINIGVKSIVAPMAETAFALNKFLKVVKVIKKKEIALDTDFHFNMETITAYENLSGMLKLEDIDLLAGMTVGRVDLTGSMDFDRSKANSDEIYKMCEKSFLKARAKGLKTALGGAISTDSIDFITRLHEDGLIDKFETRKVVFFSESIKYGSRAIKKAVEFELLWLKNKRDYYQTLSDEDMARIPMLEARLREVATNSVPGVVIKN